MLKAQGSPRWPVFLLVAFKTDKEPADLRAGAGADSHNGERPQGLFVKDE